MMVIENASKYTATVTLGLPEAQAMVEAFEALRALHGHALVGPEWNAYDVAKTLTLVLEHRSPANNNNEGKENPDG